MNVISKLLDPEEQGHKITNFSARYFLKYFMHVFRFIKNCTLGRGRDNIHIFGKLSHQFQVINNVLPQYLIIIIIFLIYNKS